VSVAWPHRKRAPSAASTNVTAVRITNGGRDDPESRGSRPGSG
jgi:hypothetical protein